MWWWNYGTAGLWRIFYDNSFSVVDSHQISTSPTDSDNVAGEFDSSDGALEMVFDFTSLGTWVYDGRYDSWYKLANHSPDNN